MEEEQKAVAEAHEEVYNDVDYKMPQEVEGYIPNEDMSIPIEEPVQLDDYIMGKPSKAKEKHIKIRDISANDGRVTLEGRVTSSDVRETKSGKGMIIFELKTFKSKRKTYKNKRYFSK